jgi:regulator of RNase E activity RraA
MDTREKLLSVSTATLTTQLFKRGFRNVFIHGLRSLNPARDRLCGPAFTLRYIPAREDLDHIGVFEDRSHPQRVAIEQCPAGAVLIIDSRGDSLAASAGGILITRLMVRGAAGIVTDGGLRDTPEIARIDFPSFCRAASAPTNLIRHHAVGINEPIGCGGVAVYPGDIAVGDGDGVVIIPAHLADEVAEASYQQERFEEFVTEKVREGRSIFGLYPPDAATRAEYEARRK